MGMMNEISEDKILFIDIETVSQYSRFEEMPGNWKYLWNKKADLLKKEANDTPETVYSRAGIYAEFGKIICICAGFHHNGSFRIKAYSGDDEKQVLIDFIALLNEYFPKQFNFLCAHNGKEFDFPYLSRRILVNGLSIPGPLDFAGKKPWEVPHLDTMELWKFGDYKNYSSLELLASVFGIATPKDDIAGNDIYRVYWEEQDLERIVRYCRKDVVTIAQIFRRYQGKELILPDQIIMT
jgi:hypothetical protein